MKNLLKLYIGSRNLDEKLKIKYNPELAMQYLKWLKYTSKEEQEKINIILNKKSSELTNEEISQLKLYKHLQDIIPIFERYFSDECKKSDLLLVFDFIQNNLLYDLMIAKLTKNELQMAQIKIDQLKCLPDFELSKLIKEKMTFEAYMELSMIDAFCINRLSSILKVREDEKSDIEISAQINSKRIGYLI